MQLEDGRRSDASQDRNLGTDVGDEDHVAWFEADIFGFVAVQQQVVQVEVGDCLAAALDLYVAQAALWDRAAGRKESIEKSAERTDSVTSGLSYLTDKKDLMGGELAEVYVEMKFER